MKARALLVATSIIACMGTLPAHSAPMPECGTASWYVPSQPDTGDGQDAPRLTAAHPSLPFGTKVRVENLGNGRSVTVEINDRGPFTRDRIIDVSRAAAARLDFVGDGVAQVKLSRAGASQRASSKTCR
jgi:peptidoglycan lytic transglycosylase